MKFLIVKFNVEIQIKNSCKATKQKKDSNINL